MTLKESLVVFAKHNAEADAAVAAIVDKLSALEREKERGSFYHSISGLVRHLLGGTVFLCGVLKDSLSKNAAVAKALETLAGLPRPPEKELSDAQWADLKNTLAAADKAYIALTESLSDEDTGAEVDASFFKWGKPIVPAAFMLQQVVTHNEHHRGQISQILDELKIDNNYSGVSPANLD